MEFKGLRNRAIRVDFACHDWAATALASVSSFKQDFSLKSLFLSISSVAIIFTNDMGPEMLLD